LVASQREKETVQFDAIYLLRISLVAKCQEGFALLENPVTERAEQKPAQSGPVEQQRPVLTVQVLFGCQAYNTTPEEAAHKVVADLFEQLSQGGSVTVHIEEADGTEHTLEVTAA
jgi:hypothetical protein